ncbi:lysozyme D-like [Zeugodacus cucurbitae]|uniref:Lysozyme D n=1 Tax=Zeugodacus cucurbitae TaxID=28588 RepID=A0A0A1WP43_ZEUCU|nr:lysozyme D-like [Zeugodacus cucurbitae]
MKTPNSLLVLFALIAQVFGSRLFDRCLLANELIRFEVPKEQLARWICIAERESSFRTDAVGRTNLDGSNDYGIFQINSRYWCQPDNGSLSFNECRVSCNALLTDDISESLQCALYILRRQGWQSWSTWQYCNETLPSVDECF